MAGNAVGLVAAALAAISPMMFLPEATLMSETVFVFLVTASLLLALRAYDTPSPLRIACLGAVLGLAVLARAEAGVLGLLLLAGLFRPRPDVTAPVLRRAGLAALGLVVMAAVVVPWTIRNQQTFHEFVPVSNNVGTALAGANCQPTYLGPLVGIMAFDLRRRTTRSRACASRDSTGASPGSTRPAPRPMPATRASPTHATT